MKKAIRLASAVLAVMVLPVLSGCKIQKATPPPLTGPSELATSIRLTANPDVLRQDGASQSQITIEARDPTGQAVSNLPVRVEITVGGVFTDYGQLSAKNLVTGRDGRAYATYTAPAPSPDPVDYGTVVTILVTPTEYDFANTMMRQVSIRLVPPGIILPPNQPPTAAFTFSPGGPNERQTVQFDASTSEDVDGTIVSYSWNFGDGTGATGVNTTHAYDGGGTYTVSLTVTDNRGAVASATQSITVSSTNAPIAIFTASPTNPAINETVYFNAADSSAASGRSLTSYSWDFGDGSSRGTGVSTAHAYASTGNFVVTLTVTDDVGKTGATSSSVTVGAAPTPTATIVVSPTGANVDQKVYFDGSLSTAPAGRTISSYDWSFGDGSSGAGVTVEHRYRAVGTFSVILTVTDNTDAIGRASATVVVTAGTNPTAQFAFAPAAPVVSQEVRFDASESTAASGKTISSYAWNFGDGAVGAGVRTSHTFTRPGTFSVVLTVTDSAGLRGSVSRQVVVSTGAPTALFSFSPTSPVVNQVVSFDGRASSAVSGKTITSWSWNFGDTSSGSGSQATHTYTVAGTYAVILTVTDSASQTGSATQNVTVGSGLPTAAFTFAPTSPGVNQTVNFDATTSTAPAGRTIISYAWQFGDGTTAGNVSRPSKSYSAAGEYKVVLTVTDSAGLTDTDSQAITVTTGVPTASFSVSPEPSTIGTSVFLDASPSTAVGGQTIQSYEWNFGDATPIELCPGSPNCGGSNRTITHVYVSAGSYTITLTVTDNLGRKGSLPKVHLVSAPAAPTPSFTFTPTSPVVNESVAFDGTASRATAFRYITTWAWDFGDGTPPVTGPSPTVNHTYIAVGAYVVTLTVTDNTLSSASLQKAVVVGSSPTASFTFAPTSPVVNQAVAFDGSASRAAAGRTITTWAWNFGDSTTGTGPNLNHTYMAAGTYTVVLTVTDSAAGTGATSLIVVVRSSALAASFTFAPMSPVVNQAVAFDGSASSAAAGQASTTKDHSVN